MQSYSPEDIIEYRHNMSSLIDTYDKRCVVRAVCGAVCIGIGVSTIWFPSGSIVLIVAGSGLLGYDVKALYNRIKYEIHLFKLRILQKC